VHIGGLASTLVLPEASQLLVGKAVEPEKERFQEVMLTNCLLTGINGNTRPLIHTSYNYPLHFQVLSSNVSPGWGGYHFFSELGSKSSSGDGPGKARG
jgi:hypothetical protein